MNLSVFIPVLNGEDVLENNVNKVFRKVSEFEDDFEIVIVDDNSTDKTPDAAKGLLSNRKIRYVRYNSGPSRRENLADSFRSSKGDIVCYLDVDLSTDLSHLPHLVGNVKKGYDIAIGSRYKGIDPERTVGRILFSRAYNMTFQTLFGSRVQDHNCGFKAFRRDVILHLLEELGYDHQYARGWAWDAELLIRAQRKGYKIKELPVRWKRSENSSFKLLRELKIVGHVIELKKRLG